jgi:hypothetical protein
MAKSPMGWHLWRSLRWSGDVDLLWLTLLYQLLAHGESPDLNRKSELGPTFLADYIGLGRL